MMHKYNLLNPFIFDDIEIISLEKLPLGTMASSVNSTNCQSPLEFLLSLHIDAFKFSDPSFSFNIISVDESVIVLLC